MADNRNYFKELYCFNVNENKEQKNKLDYLSWAWAWAEVKKMHPGADFKIYESKNPDGWDINYFSDGRTCWVKVGVMIDCLEHIITLPVMDFKNQSIPLEKVTSFDVNKAIMRCLAKACALHGLGLYIYAGEDLPEDDPDLKKETKPTQKKQVEKKIEEKINKIDELLPMIEACWNFTNPDGVYINRNYMKEVLVKNNVKKFSELSYDKIDEMLRELGV